MLIAKASNSAPRFDTLTPFRRSLFNAVHWIVCDSAPYRDLPNGIPASPAVYEQMWRWMAGGLVEVTVHEREQFLDCAVGLSCGRLHKQLYRRPRSNPSLQPMQSTCPAPSQLGQRSLRVRLCVMTCLFIPLPTASSTK